jgi:hypothetical protein
LTANSNYTFLIDNVFYTYQFENEGSYAAVSNVSVANDVYAFNVAINTTSLSISNSTLTFTLRSPTLAQKNDGNYYLNANGSWNLVTATASVNTDAQYVWNNTHIFNSNLTVNGSILSVNANASFAKISTFNANVILGSSGLSANGSFGTAGQVLHSNGTATYWAADDAGGGTVTSVASGNGLSGGPITTTGTLSVLANSGIVSNTTGLYVNSTYIGTLTANNTSFVGSTSAANVVSNTQLQSNLANYQTTAGLSANVFTLTANNSTFAFGKSEGDLNVNSAIYANGSITNTFTVGTSAYFVSNGNVGIGTSSPSVPLQIAYTSGVPNSSLLTTDTLVISAGNTSPGFAFVVAGTSASQRGVFKATRTRGTLENPTAPNSGDDTFTLIGAVYDGAAVRATAAVNMAVDGSVSSGVAPQRITFLTGNASSRIERMRIDSSGNVGIGNTAPNATLAVTGTANISGNVIIGGISTFNANVVLGSVGLSSNGSFGTAGHVLHSNGTATYWAADDNSGGTVTSVATGNGMTGGTITSTGTVSVLANTGIIANTTGVFVNAAYINTISSNSATFANSSVTNTFTVGTASYFVANGNFGIGNTAPNATLAVTGTANISGNVIIGGITTLTGNVVIGTTTPSSSAYPFYVESASGLLVSAGSNVAATSPTIGVSRRRTGLASVISGDSLGEFSGFGWDGASFIEASRIETVVDGSPSTNDMPGRLVFSTTADGASSPTERMRITSTGDVGIGNTAPNARLQVTGTANVSGNVAIGGITTFSGNIILGSSGFSANGSFGTAGHVLHSNGTATYWDTDDNAGGTVTSVATGNGMTGGTITSTGTVSVLANTGIVANATGVFVNDAHIATLSANSATFLGAAGNFGNSTGIYTSGIVNAVSFTAGTLIANNSILRSPSTLTVVGGGATAEGGQIVIGYGNNLATTITGQANNTFNIDVTGGNTGSTPLLRIFAQNGDGTTTAILNAANTGRVHIGSTAEQTDSTFKVTGTANVTSTFRAGGAATMASTLNVTGVTTLSANLSVASALVRSWSATDTDIDSLLPGSTFGTIIEGAYNGHLVLGIRDNDASDSVSIISGGGDYAVANTYDQSVAFFRADGRVSFGRTAPGTDLELFRNINDISSIAVRNSNTGAAAQARFDLNTGTTNSFVVSALLDNSGSPYYTLASGTAVSQVVYDFNQHIFRSQSGATEYARFISNGNFGIGNSAPNAKLQVTGTANVSGNVAIAGITTFTGNIVLGSVGLSSNGSFGTAGHVLHSNGTATYWAADDAGGGTVTSVATGNGMTGGTITTTGTLAAVAGAGVVVNASGINVLANNGIVANSTGTFVNANTGIVANATGVFVNATYVGTISSNNASFLGGTAAASYVQNTDSRTLSGNLVFSGITTFTGNVVLGSVGLSSNGSFGTAGHVLHSNGTATYWAADDNSGGTVTSVATGNGMTGGTITTTGTVSILANTGIVANATGVFVNAAYINTISSNSATFANSSVTNTFTVGTAAYFVANGNVGIGNTAPNAKFQVTGTANVSGNVAIAGITTFTGNVVLGSVGLSSNGSFGTAGHVLHSNGTATYWAADDNSGGTVTSVASGNGLTGGPITTTGTLAVGAGNGITVNATAVAVLANNGLTSNATGVYVVPGNGLVASNSTGVHVGAGSGVTVNATAVSVNPNTGIVANATGVYVNATYIGTLSANNASFLGGTAAASYQTTAGLSANVATLTSNNATNAFGKTEGALNVNSATTALTANNSTNLGGQAAAYYTNATNITTGTLPYARIPANVINTTAAFTRTGITTFSANVVLGSSGLSSNGGFGTAGHVLHSNGSATYWAADDNSGGTVTSVATGNGLTGGTITATGTISVIANNGLSANATGVYVVPGNGLVASNSTGVHVGAGSGVTINSTAVAVLANTGVVANATGVHIGQAVATTSNVQFGSLGVGTAASGVTGEIRANNNITAFYTSDIRLKENIKNIESPIDKIKLINGVEFDWTDDYIKEHGGEDGYFIRKHDVGVIAQEIEKILPEVVATKGDGIKAVKYDRIVALLIEAIKDQQGQIEVMKAEINKLKGVN